MRTLQTEIRDKSCTPAGSPFAQKIQQCLGCTTAGYTSHVLHHPINRKLCEPTLWQQPTRNSRNKLYIHKQHSKKPINIERSLTTIQESQNQAHNKLDTINQEQIYITNHTLKY